MIAEVFGRPCTQVAEGHAWREGSLLILDGAQALGEGRSTHKLPAEELSLADLASFCEGLDMDFQGKAVLITRLHLRGCQDEDQRDAQRLLGLLSQSKRLSFMRCSAPPCVSLSLISVAAGAIRTGTVQWTSLGLVPSWSSSHGEDFPEHLRMAFAAALEDFLAAVRETCSTHDIYGFDLPNGIGGYLPCDRQHLPLLFHDAFSLKRVAHTLACGGGEAADLRQKLQRDFTAHNPLLQLPATLERKLLKKGDLLASESVAAAMAGDWQHFLSNALDLLAAHLESLERWAPLTGLEAASEEAELLRCMADEAFLYVLKMRPSSHRPGLDVARHVRHSVDLRGIHAKVPHTVGYMLRHGI